jgi:hypothetical protein
VDALPPSLWCRLLTRSAVVCRRDPHGRRLQAALEGHHDHDHDHDGDDEEDNDDDDNDHHDLCILLQGFGEADLRAAIPMAADSKPLWKAVMQLVRPRRQSRNTRRSNDKPDGLTPELYHATQPEQLEEQARRGA